MFKLNTFYQYNVEFTQLSRVENMKLYFEAETESVYKIAVRVLVPNEVTGCEDTLYRRVYDENMWFQVCENAYKKPVADYFKESSVGDDTTNEANSKQETNKPPVDLNCINVQLPVRTVRYLRV